MLSSPLVEGLGSRMTTLSWASRGWLASRNGYGASAAHQAIKTRLIGHKRCTPSGVA